MHVRPTHVRHVHVRHLHVRHLHVGHLIRTLVGMLVVARHAPRDERGLSQSAENAILLVGAATVAGIVITAMVAYVKSHMPK